MICVCDDAGGPSSRVVEAEHGAIENVQGKAGITSDFKKLTCNVHNDLAITNYQETLQNVNEINENGNEHFKKYAYADALRKYKEGIELLLNYSPEFPADRKDKKRHLYKLFNNIAETYLGLQQPHLACATFEASVMHGIPFFNGKLHHRNAKGLFEQKKFKEALKSLEESLRIDPGQTKVVTMGNQVLGKIKLEAEQEAGRKIKRTAGVKGKSVLPKKVRFAEPISNKLLDQKLCSADKLTIFSFDVDVKLEF